MAEFLLEIGTEEIPARMLARAERDLKDAIGNLLREARLSFNALRSCSAPRQLVVYARNIAARQEDREETILGPPLRIAYDADGKPTKALEGFLRKNTALRLEDLIEVEQKKGPVVAGKLQVVGRDARDIFAEGLAPLLEGLHFPKTMRWEQGQTRFVRPVRNLLALLDGEVIPFHYGGIASGNRSFGHRFIAAEPFAVTSLDHYLGDKEKRGVILRHQDRLQRIRRQIEAHLQAIGGRLVTDDALLEEVADLVECPYVVLGSFDRSFLDIPKEVLITSLRDHQKSFTVQDADGALMPYFLSIANVAEDRKGLIRKGNEWVLNARLWDAKFFWESDLKKDFAGLREKLKNLVFQAKIGSYYDKTARLEQLVRFMAESLGGDEAEIEAVARAARECKTDLVSELVFEFPELQGMTGGLLLEKKDVSPTVARAVYEHYLPLSMDGELPATPAGRLVSIADKLDTLVGCFGVGLIPTGAKDPYALRRAAQGIVRILIEAELPLPLGEVIARALAQYQDALPLEEDLGERLHAFFSDRLRYYLKREGYEPDLIRAVLARDSDRVDQTLKRAQAIRRQQEETHFRSLALNLKRMNNVVADEEDRLPDFDPDLLSEPAERELWQRYLELKPQIEAAVAARDYNAAMDRMTALSEPVERYFGLDGVFVNVEETPIRLNRKSMLHQIRRTLGLVADISCLEPV